jgi:mannose-1-phosphate guanylyltransferase
MEKATNVAVVLADFGWSDLGTWGSLYTHVEADEDLNAAIGENVLFFDSSSNMVSANGNKLTVLQGLEDYIVVDTDDILMVVRKQDEQKIKQIVAEIKRKKGGDLT